MPECRKAITFLDDFLESPRAEGRLFRRFVAASAIFHTLIMVLLLVRTGTREQIPPPVRIISVELETFEPSQQKPVPPVSDIKPITPPVRNVSPVRPARPVALPIGKELKPQPTIPPQVMEAPRGSASEEPGKPLPSVTVSKHDAARSFPSSPSVASRKETDNIQSARPSENTTALSAYMKVCRQLIEKHKEYPIMARKGRREGTALIHVVLKRDGSLDQSGVGKSSGYNLLDNAALRSVKSVGTFPSLPPELQGNELTFDVPISFKLSND